MWGNGGLANLGATVIEQLRTSAVCLSAFYEDLGVFVTPHRGGANQITVRVLCAQQACRRAAAADEEELFLVEHPGTAKARRWATRRAVAGLWQRQAEQNAVARAWPGPAVALRPPGPDDRAS